MQRLNLYALAAQNIAAPLLIATYTADADRELLLQVLVSGAAGGGAYSVYLTRQLLGVGVAYQSPTVAPVLGAGVAAGYLFSTTVPVQATDVVKIYVQGQAGDTSVATAVEVFDVSAAGVAAIAAAVWDRLTSALTTVGSVGAYVLQKLGLLTTDTTVTIAAPVAGTAVSTYMGDDYLAEDGRALAWTVSSAATLAGGTVAVIVHGIGSFAGVVASETNITCGLTRTQSAGIPVGRYRYQVVVAQADNDVVTVVDGTWESKAKASAT